MNMKNAFLLVVMTLVISVHYVQSGAKSTVKIGVLALRGPEVCLEQWKPTADYLSSKIPEHRFEIIPLRYNEVIPAVKTDEVDFLLVNPSLYVELEIEKEVSCLATLKNMQMKTANPVYGGVVFCRNDRKDISGVADLRKKSFMGVAENSLGGWLIIWKELKDKKINPFKDFSEVCFGGTQDEVVFAVLSGKVDAGAVRTEVLESMAKEHKIDLRDFRVLNQKKHAEFSFLCSTELYPEWSFVKCESTPSKLSQKVRDL